MNEVTDPAGNQRIWPILWRGKYVILASVVVMVGLAFAYTAHAAKVYQATGILQVNLPTSQPGSQDTTAANQGLAQNYASLLVSSGFLNAIRSGIDGGRLSTDDLQSRLTASAVPMTALVQLGATGDSPNNAQTTASQVLTAFVAQLQTAASARTAQEQQQLAQAVSKLVTQIAALQASPPSPRTAEQISSLQSARSALIGQNANLVANGVAQGTSATVSAPPVASPSPTSPRPALNAIAGLLAGILLGLGLAWLRETLRSALRSADDAAALVDLPVLASIPLRPQAQADDPVLREAYGILYTNLLFALHNHDLRIVTFVGFNPQVGKTSVVQGIAESSAGADRSMLIVDGDMRAATLSSRLGYEQHPGFVDVLQGAIELDQALVPLRPGLSLLPTRLSRVNPPSLLSGNRMQALSAELRERFDVVLIDTPPIAGLADGLILSSLADMVVLVARAGLTKPSDLQAAATSVEQIRAPIAGLVVFEDVVSEPYYPHPSTTKSEMLRAATLP